MKQRKFSFLAIGILLALGASGAFATATMQFILDGAVVMTCVDETGCDGALGSVGILTATYSNVGVTISVGTGSTKPGVVNPTVMDLDDVTATLASGHTLSIAFSDTGFTGAGGFKMHDGGNLDCGGGTCGTQGWSFYDTTSPLGALFGNTGILPAPDPATGVLISSTGLIIGSPSVGINSDTVGNGPGSGTYSITEVITLNNNIHRGDTLISTGTAFLSSDLNLARVPEPTSVLLLGTLAGIVAYAFRRKFSGNVA